MASNYSKRLCSLLFIFCCLYIPVPVLPDTKTDYCTLNCKEKHTVCKRKNKCGPEEGCETVPSTAEFRNLIVKLHNEYRNGIASGKVTAFNNTGAKMMNALAYDMELEYIAGCHCNQCNGLEHDECRSTPRFDCGQNIYMGTNIKEEGRAVNMWYEEIKDISDVKDMQKFPSFSQTDGKQRGHLTQLVWADTKYIGCARALNKKDPKLVQIQVFCNYGPAGNIVGEDVYKLATTASEIGSECKEGKDPNYPALCATKESAQTGSGGDGGTSNRTEIKIVRKPSKFNRGQTIGGSSKYKFNLILSSVYYVFIQYYGIQN